MLGVLRNGRKFNNVLSFFFYKTVLMSSNSNV